MSMDPVATTVVTNTIKAVIDPIATPLTNAIWRTVKYPFKVGANVRALQSAIDALERRRNDVRTSVEARERLGKRVGEEVVGWMERVGAIENKVRMIEQKYQSRCRCLGSLSFNCWLNYKISKNAATLVSDVQILHNQGEHYKEGTIEAPPPAVQEVSIGSTSTPTLNSNLELARQFINNDPVGVIGLWGMGGVGKTFLLQNVNNSYKRDTSFHAVVLVTVSKFCSIAKIQANMVDKLGLVADPNEERQAEIIFNFLREKNFLILLDDMWEGLDLKKVGIPYPLGLVGQYKRKVVLTTRLTRVCGQMEVRKEIHVACLNKDESLSLFQDKVGDETLGSHSSIPSLAQQVVNELGGLPLALITTGRAMYGKRRPEDWHRAIEQLRAPSLNQMDITAHTDIEYVYDRLKFSYENLPNETLKNCFLFCSLWSEDYPLVKNDLIESWIGLGCIKERHIKYAYTTGHYIIQELTQRCLLEEYHDSTGLVLDTVKMHDLIRDMAHWIARDFGDNKNKWVIITGGLTTMPNDEILWRDAEHISFMYNNFSLPNRSILSSPSSLKTLFLQENRLNDYSFSIKEDVQYLRNLQYLNLASNELSVFPLEICNLINLQYLNLSYNPINSIPIELKYLINLKFLYMKDCHITSLPEGVIAALESLEVLDFLSNYVSEIKLHYYNSSFIEELKCLKKLKALGISVRTLRELEKFNVLPIQSLIVFLLNDHESNLLSSDSLCSTETQKYLVNLSIWSKIDIDSFVIERRFPCLEKLNFETLLNLREVVWKDYLPIEVFPNLKELHIMDSDALEQITWIAHLECLQKVNLTDCRKMTALARKEESGRQQLLFPTFPSLKSITLVNLPVFESICDPDYSAFSSLRYLTIRKCPRLMKLPFLKKNIVPTLKINSDRVFEFE